MCCGRGTRIYPNHSPEAGGSRPGARARRPGTGRPVQIPFQYLGRTGLSVRGPISGRGYRFAGRGAIVAVDPRDARSLAAVPNLRRVARRPG